MARRKPARKVRLAFAWTKPYASMEVWRLGVGPFYGGEVYPHHERGFTLINALIGEAAWRPKFEQAQEALEDWVADLCMPHPPIAPVDPAIALADAARQP
jgi:hypothetical protein